MQTGLKSGFDLDPVITEHFYDISLRKALLILDTANQVFRIFGTKSAAIADMLHGVKGFRFGNHF